MVYPTWSPSINNALTLSNLGATIYYAFAQSLWRTSAFNQFPVLP
jgi:hypothetical protein